MAQRTKEAQLLSLGPVREAEARTIVVVPYFERSNRELRKAAFSDLPSVAVHVSPKYRSRVCSMRQSSGLGSRNLSM